MLSKKCIVTLVSKNKNILLIVVMKVKVNLPLIRKKSTEISGREK